MREVKMFGAVRFSGQGAVEYLKLGVQLIPTCEDVNMW